MAVVTIYKVVLESNKYAHFKMSIEFSSTRILNAAEQLQQARHRLTWAGNLAPEDWNVVMAAPIGSA